MKSVKDFNKEINSIIFSLKSIDQSNFTHDKVESAIQMLNEIEPPSPRCSSCLHKINYNNAGTNETFKCELKLAPKRIRISSSGTMDFGCNQHSEY